MISNYLTKMIISSLRFALSHISDKEDVGVNGVPKWQKAPV